MKKALLYIKKQRINFVDNHLFAPKVTMKFSYLLILLFPFIFGSSGQQAELLNGEGSVSFVSTAPLETIKATSEKLKGIIDLSEETFAFSFQVSSFNGFNSPLQKEHFNEHYMESAKFPNASYTGKILSLNPCNDDCVRKVITKGKLSIHGVTRVVTIPATIKISDGNFDVKADFKVKLTDYGIEIPLILEGKIAPIIDVNVSAQFERNA